MFNSKRFLTDSRTFIYYFKKGHLQGYDNNSNIILSQSFERVFSSDQGVQTVDLGLYLIKGDNLVCASEIDTTIDDQNEWSNVKADPIQSCY
ncbi:hypothetical protein E3Q22_01072 [Wallemia mellicola]|uniref:LSM2-LSM8 complex subunit LSM8 n=1 Tax=Wallemia mellicola TaxID=1708541 RepID=A0A4T0NWC8_9BASI|nr:hypothetical protein E3Q23_01917 [Wallemia mellicola]TIB81319.1 hypothetical protein E3Q22_01072 [Wallemia mellicola]TIB94119.1 hypothetical protein E3Q19_00578 [Wallemia mellicola]TIC01920.1 hypothetical protein E3Q18_00446 [Wallemia mellicola]TIC75731.1 hypothetical protein E3Q00_00572 [Wallemia mellicola]